MGINANYHGATTALEQSLKYGYGYAGLGGDHLGLVGVDIDDVRADVLLRVLSFIADSKC